MRDFRSWSTTNLISLLNLIGLRLSVLGKTFTQTKGRLIASFFVLVLLADIGLAGYVPYKVNAQSSPKALGLKSAAPDNPSKSSGDLKTKTQTADTVSGYVPPVRAEAEVELLDKKEANKDVFLQKDGTVKTRTYWDNVNFKKNGKWTKIDTNLDEDTNPAGGPVSGLLGKISSAINSTPKTFKVRDNDWQAKFAPSDNKSGMLKVDVDGQTVSYKPVNANKVTPVKITQNGKDIIRYTDLWKGIDVDYIVQNSVVKEYHPTTPLR
jgi:hypothetical protein